MVNSEFLYMFFLETGEFLYIFFFWEVSSSPKEWIIPQVWWEASPSSDSSVGAKSWGDHYVHD